MTGRTASDRVEEHRAPNPIRCPCGDPFCILINAIKDYTGWPEDKAIDVAYAIKGEMDA